MIKAVTKLFIDAFIHPIFTLIAMYTGFKFIGIIGMFVGPIILIVLKNIFATFIDKGVVKSIFER